MPLESSAGQRKAISGKLFVIPFGLLILFLLWLLFSIAVRFQVLMVQMEKTRAAWPAAATELQPRYNDLRQSAELSQSDRQEEIARLIAEVKMVTQFDQQSPRVSKLEWTLKDTVPPVLHPHPWGQGIQEVISLEQNRESLQNDFIGRCTMHGLRLIMPPIFKLPQE